MIDFLNIKNKLLGTYIGTVISTSPDTKSLGRVKCEIRGILSLDQLTYPDESEGTMLARDKIGRFPMSKIEQVIRMFPWVYRSASLSTALNTPNINDQVYIQFLNGDIHFPIYIGLVQDSMDVADRVNQVHREVLGGVFNPVPSTFSSNIYCSETTFITNHGHILSISDSTESVTIHNGYSFGDIDTSITLKSSGDVDIKSSMNVNINSAAEISLNARAITLNGDKISLNASSPIYVNTELVTKSITVENSPAVAVMGINGSIGMFYKGKVAGM